MSWDQAAIGGLSEVLAALYPDLTASKRVVVDARLDPALIAFDNRALINWFSILQNARLTNTVENIIRIAQRDFPGNEGLTRALLTRSHQSTTHREWDDISAPLTVLADHSGISIGGIPFRYVRGGTAWVGSDDGYPHERPRHWVQISSFFLQETPITNRQFAAFAGTVELKFKTTAELGFPAHCLIDGQWILTGGADWRHPLGPGSSVDEKGDHPVVQVSWYDGMAYCRWLSRAAGFDITLPTETQWEYAAGGPDGLAWPFGHTYQSKLANIEGLGTTPVRRFAPTASGLYDMAGNVYEWCADWYTDSWTRAGHELGGGPTLDPQGPATGKYKVLRGGSWFDVPQHCRCANRYYAAPVLSSANWGIRCCLVPCDRVLQALKGSPIGM